MKTLTILTLLSLSFALISCQESNDFEPLAPTFEIVSFIKVDSLVNVSIKVEGLRDNKFSIDGILKADNITAFDVQGIKSESISFTNENQHDDINHIIIYGSYAEDLIINISFVCLNDHQTYLNGWKLNYGFGEDCKVLYVELKTK